jgi:hypothetical protein
MTGEPATARGAFDVKMTPEAVDAGDGGVTVSRLAIDKQYRGDLTAEGKGVMLSATTAVKGSAGYTAMERVTGALHGRRGSFVLQHTGTMTRGAPQLTIAIVPDSGTGELTGIVGSCGITIADGAHFYELQYTCPDAT